MGFNSGFKGLKKTSEINSKMKQLISIFHMDVTWLSVHKSMKNTRMGCMPWQFSYLIWKTESILDVLKKGLEIRTEGISNPLSLPHPYLPRYTTATPEVTKYRYNASSNTPSISLKLYQPYKTFMSSYLLPPTPNHSYWKITYSTMHEMIYQVSELTSLTITQYCCSQ